MKKSLQFLCILGCVMGLFAFALAGVSNAAGDELALFKKAKIDWQQFKGTELTIAMNKHPFTQSLLPLIPQFEQLTGMKVKYLILPEEEYFQKIEVDLSSKQGVYSVFMCGPMRNWGYVTPGWMEPLDKYLADPKLTDKQWYEVGDFYPTLITANRWNGKIGGGIGEGNLWSIPVMFESYLLPYRKDLYEKYRLKVPMSLDEMAHNARVIKEKTQAEGKPVDGIITRGLANTSTIGTAYLSALKAYTGGKWSEFDKNMHSTLGDPRVAEFTEKWVGMIRESGPKDWTSVTWYDGMERFAAGTAAMYPDCDFFAASYENPEKSKVVGKVGYALLPPGPNGFHFSGLWTWALGISKNAPNKKAAWLFIEWATSKRNLLEATVKYRNYNPVRKSIFEDSEVVKIMGGWGDYLKTVKENVMHAHIAWLPQPQRVALGDLWGRALHEVWSKRKTAAQALKEAAEADDKLMKRAGLAR
jgi:multiple sugar transport system substrate-binding protein